MPTATMTHPSLPSTAVEDTVAATLAQARQVLSIESEALTAVSRQLTADFVTAIDLLQQCQGRVVITGMGKSGHIGQKMAATFSSTGTPALFLHPAEGSHGDLGTLTRQDVVIAISNSGETPEILAVLPLIKRFGLPLIAMTGGIDSTLSRQADALLNVSVPQEACPLGLAPTASTTATLALGDALAVVLLERRGFTPEDFAMFHPAGSLGKRLLWTVSDLMRSGVELPIVSSAAGFISVLSEMNQKTLGLALVMSATQGLLGIITDGDIRRGVTQQSDVSQLTAATLMSTSPKTIRPDALALEALRHMEEHRITVLVVQRPEESTPCGVIHLHDVMRAGIA
ncbi:MAG: KpsF/GutQ family sugar-phosphate isomerase [Vampirovibrionales bacterium]|nr:KpsF/GutQ family sugar-phosphate isomerase [Vampirovibrionales bacterium]